MYVYIYICYRYFICLFLSIPKEPRTLEFVGPILRTRFSGEIQKKTGFLQKKKHRFFIKAYKNHCFNMQWSTFPSFSSWTSLPPSNRIKRLHTCASLRGDLQWECQIENMELAWQPPPDFWMKHGLLARYGVLPPMPDFTLGREFAQLENVFTYCTCPVGNICRSAPNPKTRCHFRQIGAKRLELWRENCIQKLHCRFFWTKRKVLAVNPYFIRREPVFYP